MRSHTFTSGFDAIRRPVAVCPENDPIADGLDELAELLASKDANAFRVRAYHSGANLVRKLNRPVKEILDRGGRAALLQLPGVGDSLSISMARLAATGELPLLKRLRGRAGNAALLQTVPGIGSKTAELIRQQLGINTLAELEIAAHDGRLAALPGLGHKRLQAVQDSLAGRLGNRRGSWAPPRVSPDVEQSRGSQAIGSGLNETRRSDARHSKFPTPLSRNQSSREKFSLQAGADEPSVTELLSLDSEFRQKERAGQLPRVAPLRFNPDREAWLPILHTRREGRKYKAMYSNTPLANEQHTTHDWVIIVREGRHASGQWTVVTERSGDLQGRRVVRGRESECKAYYATHADRQPTLFE